VVLAVPAEHGGEHRSLLARIDDRVRRVLRHPREIHIRDEVIPERAYTIA
jgi:hypothetical protein